MCIHVCFIHQSECEQLNYARQLKERLEAFTQDFLPHMKEEEEVNIFRTLHVHTVRTMQDRSLSVMDKWTCVFIDFSYRLRGE